VTLLTAVVACHVSPAPAAAGGRTGTKALFANLHAPALEAEAAAGDEVVALSLKHERGLPPDKEGGCSRAEDENTSEQTQEVEAGVQGRGVLAAADLGGRHEEAGGGCS